MSKVNNHPIACNADSIVTILRQRAAQEPERIAYRFCQADGQAVPPITYRELDRRAQAVGAWLQQRGARGERVLLLYPFGLEFIVGFYGCLYAGAVAVPLYPPRPNRPDQRLLSVTADAQPRFAFTTAKVLTALSEHVGPVSELDLLHWLATDEIDVEAAATWCANEPEPTTLAFLQYTSGSTGTPKGVMVTHANLMHNAALLSSAFGVTNQSTGLMWTPFYHDMGLIGGVIQPIYAGRPTTLLSPVEFLQQPSRWLQAISAERISVSGGPNFAYELCIDKITPAQCEGLDLSCWDVAFCGAEPVRAETLERFTAKFAPYGFRFEAFAPCLGMAESTLMTSCTPPAQAPVITTFDANALVLNRVETPTSATVPAPNTQRLVSSGHAWLDQTFCIVHPETATRCAPDEVGEIWIAGPSVAGGYWQRPIESAQTFGATIADSGEGPFLRSGDLGFIHNGELFVTGRLKDLIIIRGKNYYPQDLEATVEHSHPALQPGAVAAFSVDAANEEKLVIVQEVERTHLRNLVMSELFAAIRYAVAQEHGLQVSAIALLRPGRILKTSSGKIQRRATRQAYLAGELETVGLWSLGADTRTDSIPTVTDPAPPAISPFNPAVNGRVLFTTDYPTHAIEGWIASQLAQRLHTNPSAIDLHKPFADYGLDSVAAVELVHALRTWLQSTGRDSTLEVTDLWDFPTIAALARHLAGEQRPLLASAHRTFTPPVLRTAWGGSERPTAVTPANPGYGEPELVAELTQLVRLLS